MGTRVANLLAADPLVEILGIDLDPPRRRLVRADFLRIDPRDRQRIVAAVRAFAPTTVVHLGVYEPNARSGPQLARRLTHDFALHALGAAAQCASLEHVVVRSGIEIYGRARGAATRPDEAIPPQPTSGFGRSLLEMEELARACGEAASVPVTALRCAPIVGPHMASPLGRLLRLPLVPVGGLSDLPFSVVHEQDAAAALMLAYERRHDGPINVVAPGAVTASQAARLGARLAVPVVGPQWWVARLSAELLGAPIPGHVKELLLRGRTASAEQAAAVLGWKPVFTTAEVVMDLYEWATVTTLRAGREMAA